MLMEGLPVLNEREVDERGGLEVDGGNRRKGGRGNYGWYVK